MKMTHTTLKGSAASRDSVALQYLRAQVTRQMAGVYAAFGSATVERKPAETRQNAPSSSAHKNKR